MSQVLVETIDGATLSKDLKKHSFMFFIFLIFGILIFTTVNEVHADTSFPSSATNLSVPPSANSLVPKVVVIGDTIHTAWTNGTDVVYSKSSNAGSSFSTPVKLGSTSTVTPTNTYKLNFAASGDYVYVVWYNTNTIFLASSSNGGSSFSAATSIGTSSTSSPLPAIAADGSTVHVVWRSAGTVADILYRKSTDGGATFSPSLASSPTTIGNTGTTCPFACALTPDPQIGISGNKVFVMWQQSTNMQLAISTDGGTTFSTTHNLGATGSTGDSNPELLVTDDKIYTLWKNGATLVFRKSLDGGTTFSPSLADLPTTIVSSGITTSSNQKMDSFSDNLYIVWSGGSPTDILFRSSANNGTTFSPDVSSSPTDINDSANAALSPSISAYENNIFIAWREDKTSPDTDIHFRSSTKIPPTEALAELLFENSLKDTEGADNDGTAVSGTAKFGNGFQGLGQALILDGSYHVSLANEATFDFDRTSSFSVSVWVKTSSSSEQVLVGKSNTIGSTGWVVSLTSTGQVQTSLTNTATTNEAKTLANLPAVNDGLWHHVAITYDGTSSASGIKTYVDGTLRAATAQSDTLSGSILNDLTATVGGTNSGASKFTGRIDGLRIYSKVLSTSEINQLAGKSQTTSFDGTKDISSNAYYSELPSLSSTKSTVYAVWTNKTNATPSIDGKILFKKGTVLIPTVKFVESPTTFRLTEEPTIRVTDTTKSGSVDVKVKSSLDPTGFTLTLPETSTGVFQKQIKFITSGSSGGFSLLVKAGSSITLEYESLTASGSIYSRTINTPEGDTYDRGFATYFTVTDQNSNLNTAVRETIQVTATSVNTGKSATFTLTETGENTGVFGSSADTKLVFSGEDNEFEVNKSIKIILEHPPANINSAIKEITSVTIQSSGFACPCPTGSISATLTETDVNSSFFEGTIELTTGDSVPGSKIKVKEGDILSITTSSPSYTTRALIKPTSQSVGLVPVKTLEPTPPPALSARDFVNLSFGGVTKQLTIQAITGEPGGGGGGLVRPGLVVNLLAGATTVNSIFGGGGDRSPPAIKTSSISIFENPAEGQGGIIKSEQTSTASNSKSPKKTTSIGEPVSIKFNIAEPMGKGGIEHVTLYFNEKKFDKYLENNNFIRFDKYKGITVNDKTGMFSNAKFELIDNGKGDLTLKFDMAFAKDFESADMMLDVWDIDRRSSKEMFEGAIKVQEKLPSTEIVETKETPTTVPTPDVLEPEVKPKEDKVPTWIKTTAGWWSERQINDQDFVLGIEHLIKNGVIEIPSTSSDEAKSQVIPAWIRNTANWWSSDKISDTEFIQAVQWLISRGVMKV